MSDPHDIACVEEVEVMTEYLEGALSAEDARRLEQHLELCPGCTEYLRQMRAIAGGLGALGGEPLPAAMREQLIARFRGL